MDEDYEFSRPFMWKSCPHCNYVFEGHDASAGHKLTCPKCGRTEFPSLYPDPTALRLLDIVGYFDVLASAHAAPLPDALVSAVHEEVARSFSSKQLIQLSQQLEQLWNRRARNHRAPSIEELVQRTRKTLNLATDEEAQRVWPMVIGYSGTVNEHIAVTIIACTFLEAMFDHLLERIGTSAVISDEDYDAVVKRIEGLRSFEARTDCFKDLTNQSFKAAVDAIGRPSFYTSWDRVRTARNDFVHGNPYAIKAPIAVLAVQLAKDAVPLFARLQNACAVRTLQEVQGDEVQNQEGIWCHAKVQA